jgi:hypothetical protein
MPHWVLRLCLVLPPGHLPVLVSGLATHSASGYSRHPLAATSTSRKSGAIATSRTSRLRSP